jgi:hypothetical protein
MRRLVLPAILGLLAVMTLAGPVGAREFGAAYINDEVYRVFGNKANVPDYSGTDPFAIFTNSSASNQYGVAEFGPGAQHGPGHHGGRWAVYSATWNEGADSSELVTSWTELQMLVTSGEITLVRDGEADFRCPVLGNPQPIQ